jgi:hypothetical protein
MPIRVQDITTGEIIGVVPFPGEEWKKKKEIENNLSLFFLITLQLVAVLLIYQYQIV